MPLTLTATGLDVGGFGATLFCHATPRDDEEVIWVDSSLERWADVLSTVDGAAGAVVCGHTHMSVSATAVPTSG